MSRERYERAYRTFGSVAMATIGLGLSALGLLLLVDTVERSDWCSLWVVLIPLGVGPLFLIGTYLEARDALRARRPRPAPLVDARLAMPLSTGASSAQLFGAPMMLAHFVAFGPIFLATRLPEWTVYPLGILGAGWFFAAVGLVLGAWVRRPSDLRMGADGLQIVGGPMHGTRQDRARLRLRPETIRAQVRAAGELDETRAASERLLRRLLAQPGARATTLLLLLAIPPLLLGFPLTSILFDGCYQLRGALSWTDGVASFAGAGAASYALIGIVRAQVAVRRALCVVATTFAAQPPAHRGEPWRCRQCGAPLPDRPGELVVGCVHCGADSIIGIDLVPITTREQAQPEDLREELRHRLTVRRRHRWSTAGWVAVLAVRAMVVGPTLVTLV